ncbi:MAG: hypothetical protein LQ347_002649 [Umbilicaria vellea]|nr:MAG: hypothetical protein LQ347_002649 [Umbilicaria vellea]
MDCDTQSLFQKLRIDTSASLSPTASKQPTASRDNGSDGADRLADHDAWLSAIQQGPLDTNQASAGAVESNARHLAYLDDESHAPTPPIDMPAATADFPTWSTDNDSFVDESRYYEPSPLEEFLRNRRPSISFNPQVTLESGHRHALEEPLPKLHIETPPRGRSLFQAETHHLSHLPGKVQTDAERFNYRPIADQLHQSPYKPRESLLRRRIPQSPRYPVLHNLGSGNKTADLERDASLTSASTASPVTEEVRTPPNGNMECLSPISAYSPFHHPISLEESSAWPKIARRQSAQRTKGYILERSGSSPQGGRRSSRRSSSSISPAVAFLSKWAKEERAPEPDEEGQEIGDYVLGKQIGFGGFSTIREAYTLEGGQRMCRAVKIVRKQVNDRADLENEQLQAEFEHEVGLWRCLSHRHILPLIAVHVTDFATFCFTKLNTGGTLFDLVRANRQGLPRDLARRYAYQLASAIRYLHHDVRVVHRDLKLENCLIDLSGPNAAIEGGHLLLCDFGLSEFITNETRSNSRCNSPDPYEGAADRPPPRNIGPSETSTSVAGSLQYASPELIRSPAGLLSTVVDLWAFGVIVYTLLVGDLPFQHMFLPRVQMMILAGEWDQSALRRAKGAAGTEEEVLELVRGCLEMQSEDRWTVTQVLESRWLNGCEEMLAEINSEWKAD